MGGGYRLCLPRGKLCCNSAVLYTSHHGGWQKEPEGEKGPPGVLVETLWWFLLLESPYRMEVNGV